MLCPLCRRQSSKYSLTTNRQPDSVGALDDAERSEDSVKLPFKDISVKRRSKYVYLSLYQLCEEAAANVVGMFVAARVKYLLRLI